MSRWLLQYIHYSAVRFVSEWIFLNAMWYCIDLRLILFYTLSPFFSCSIYIDLMFILISRIYTCRTEITPKELNPNQLWPQSYIWLMNDVFAPSSEHWQYGLAILRSERRKCWFRPKEFHITKRIWVRNGQSLYLYSGTRQSHTYLL